VQRFEVTEIGRPEPWLIEAAASIGLDFSGLVHEITDHFKNHVKKRHGQGALAILDTDFDLIPGIVKAPAPITRRCGAGHFTKSQSPWT
jgi:hypothetical protein